MVQEIILYFKAISTYIDFFMSIFNMNLEMTIVCKTIITIITDILHG